MKETVGSTNYPFSKLIASSASKNTSEDGMTSTWDPVATAPSPASIVEIGTIILEPITSKRKKNQVSRTKNLIFLELGE
jgi:hypothetical protein